MNTIIWLVLDSARYDAAMAAYTPWLDLIGPKERRWSYASWTAPSHYAFLMGLLPHENTPHRFAADTHRIELAYWARRLGEFSGPITFSNFVPYLSLPKFLKSLGYRTEAYVSLPVLNPMTPIATHFDRFELMEVHNNLAAITERLVFDQGPAFFFLNTGETHYPYALPGEAVDALPRLPGVHGVWRDLDDFLRNPGIHTHDGTPEMRFDEATLRPLWNKQVRCIEYVDTIIGRLVDAAPPTTWFIVTSDHGELFGESGYFGHGPIMHEKVFEVFLVEGPNPRASDRREL